MPDHRPTHRFDDGITEVGTTPMSEAPAAVTPPAGVALRPSSPSGRYVPGAEIARGGMGRVMVGTDTRLGREVAIKEALPQGGDLERFEREVRITARLEHPSIVPLYDAGVTQAGRPFYVMRKVSGQPLERLVAERATGAAGQGRGRGPVDERLALVPHVLAAANALGHAHRRGVLHRDVKPSNILVGDLGETVVIDWGLAKVIDEDEARSAPPVDRAIAPSGEVATQTGAVFGTPGFMAPEQARGEALDARSDVYSLGATLYHVLAGNPPLPGSLGEVLAGAHDPHRTDAALAQLAQLAVPPELTAIVDKAMQFDPASRYPDGAALADDLNRFLAGRLVAAHRYTAIERLRRFVRRHRALVAVIATSTIVLLTGGALSVRGIVHERERARQAEQAALAGQRAAERARERETDRADDAVLLKARGEVERDPTAAIATLATLAPQSRRWPQARPIAIEAQLRGVAWVHREDTLPRVFELAPDPRFLLAVGIARAKTTTTRISIIDLERHRERELLIHPAYGTAAWGERGAVIWFAPGTGGLYAIDVATGARRPPVLGGTIKELHADTAATRLVFTLDDGRAGTLDAGGVHDAPGLTAKAEQARISPDGAWTAFANAHELVVIDRDGRELARQTGALEPATLALAESGKHLAILTGDGAVVEIEIDLVGGRATTRRTTPPWKVFRIAYLKDELYVPLYHAIQMRPLHDLDNRGAEFPPLWSSHDTWQGYTAVAGGGELQLIGPTRRMLWPPIHDQIFGLAARSGSRYLALQTRSAILTWDLGDVVPELVASDVHDAWIFDDGMAIVSDLVSCDWLDLATGSRTRIATPPGVVTAQRADPTTGRQLLLVERTGQPPAAVVARRGRPEVNPIDVPGLVQADFAGDDVIAGTASGELVRVRDGAPPRTVHRFDSAVDKLLGNGTWIVAQAQSGMLARYDAATGALDTARPPLATDYAMVTRSGEIYLAHERELYRWRGRGFDRIATLPQLISNIADIQDRDTIVVTTPEHAVYAVAPDRPEAERLTRLVFHSDGTPRINGTGRYVSVDVVHGESSVLDLVTGTRWRVASQDPVTSISPTGRTGLLLARGRVSVLHFQVPDDPKQVREWVVRATNHTLDATGP